METINSPLLVSSEFLGSSTQFQTAFKEIITNKPDLVIVDESLAHKHPQEIALLRQLCLVVYVSEKISEEDRQERKFSLSQNNLDQEAGNSLLRTSRKRSITFQDFEIKNDKEIFIKTNARGVSGRVEAIIKFADVLYIESSRNYLSFHTREDECFGTYMTLKFIEPKLPLQFSRINKSVIINFDKISSIEGCDYVILNDPKIRTPIGPTYRKAFLKWKKRARIK